MCKFNMFITAVCVLFLIKIAVFGVLALVLLLGAVVFTISFFVLKKPSPTRLADVNLEEGETLTYRVDQIIELHGAQVQKGMWF